MLITPDSTSTKIPTQGFAAGPTTVTWTHTIGNGDKSIFILHAVIWQDVAGTGTITAASIGGVSLVNVPGGTGRSTGMREEIWYLLNPPKGAQTVSVTITGATDGRKFAGSSFFGVRGLLPVNTSNSVDNVGNTTITGSVTTSQGGCLIVDSVSSFGTATFTVGSGQTQILNDKTGSINAEASYKIVGAPGSYSMSWTATAGADCQIGIVAFEQAPGNPRVKLRPRPFAPGFARFKNSVITN